MTQTTHRQALVWSKKPPTTGAREEARRVRQLGKVAERCLRLSSLTQIVNVPGKDHLDVLGDRTA